MSNIKDFKITDTAGKKVADLPGSTLSGTIEQNKEAFDKLGELIIDHVNDSMDYLYDKGVDNVAEGVQQVDAKADAIDNKAIKNASDIAAVNTRVDYLQSCVGTPLVAATVAGMTDHDKIYVYTGSEADYTAGDWYYWDGAAWADGGVYNSVAFDTDTTLALSGRAADAKVTGDEITDLKEDILHSGVSVDAHIEWVNGKKSNYTTGPASETSPVFTASKPIKVPESGIYIYYPLADKALQTDERKEFAVYCYYLVNGNYVKADDYQYNMDDDLYYAVSRYMHYAEGLYISISVFIGSESAPRYGDLPHISFGNVKSVGLSVPFMFPIAVRTNSPDGSIMDIIGNNPYYYYSYSTVYGTVIPLKKAQKVICSAKYSLIAQIYKVDPNAQTDECVDLQYSNLLTNNLEHVNGLPEIDLSQYDFDGYALIGITDTFYLQGYYGRKWERMGQLARYDDVLNNVAVLWNNATIIEHDGSIPAKAKLNIDTMKKYRVNTKTFSYGSWISSSRGIIPAMNDSNFYFYTGSSVANVPLMNVNLESIKTVAENPNGRLYKSNDVSYPNSTSFGYGSVCSTMAGLITGFPSGITTTGIHNDWYPDFEGREIHNIEDVKVGDFLTYLNPDYWEYGHIVYITDIIRIDGIIESIVAIEAWPPFFRYRAFCNFDAFPWLSQSGLLNFYSAREIGSKYDHASRLPYSKYRTFRETYGEFDETDYEVTGIMCDRGKKSVYCLNQSCEISIDTSITNSISVYCDSTLQGTIDPTSISRIENDYKVIDISSMLTAPGKYTLKLNNETKEEFYVYGAQSVLVNSISGDNEHVRVSFTKINDAYPVAVMAFYKDYVVNNERETVFFVDDFTLNYLDVPKALTKLEGNVCKFDYIKVLYRTPHGTFNVLIYNYLDAWGLIDDPNPLKKQSSSLCTVTKPSADEFSDFVADTIDNNGEYMLNVLESGVWEYTSKVDNSHRLRSPGLIPVTLGMVVTYTNPVQDVYFGVAETKTSGSTGFVTSGWKAKGQTQGTYTIPKNGFLSINVRPNPDAEIAVDDYSCNIIVSR